MFNWKTTPCPKIKPTKLATYQATKKNEKLVIVFRDPKEKDRYLKKKI